MPKKKTDTPEKTKKQVVHSTDEYGVYIRESLLTGSKKIFVKYDLYENGVRHQKEASKIYDPKHKEADRNGFRPIKNIREAVKLKAKLEDQAQAGKIKAVDMTLNDCLDFWFQNKISRNKGNTKYRYSKNINVIKNSKIGKIKCSALTKKDIIDFLGVYISEGKLSTAEQLRRNISNALDYALNDDLITKNPAKNIESIPLKHAEISPPSDGHVLERLEYLRKKVESGSANYRERSLYVFVHLSCVGGFRISEIMELTWADISFDEAAISVTKIRVDVPGTSSQDSTKNSEDRIVYITDVEVSIVRSFKLYCKELLLSRGDRLKEDHYVFGTISSHGFYNPVTPLSMGCMRRWHADLLKKLGHPYKRIHDNRHYVATAMLEAGADLVDVSVRLGHKSINTTKRYTHKNKESRIREAKRMSQHLTNVSELLGNNK